MRVGKPRWLLEWKPEKHGRILSGGAEVARGVIPMWHCGARRNRDGARLKRRWPVRVGALRGLPAERVAPHAVGAREKRLPKRKGNCRRIRTISFAFHCIKVTESTRMKSISTKHGPQTAHLVNTTIAAPAVTTDTEEITTTLTLTGPSNFVRTRRFY